MWRAENKEVIRQWPHLQRQTIIQLSLDNYQL